MHLVKLSVCVLVACLSLALTSPVPAPAPVPAVTPEQYAKTAKMMRNVCQPKSGVTDDVLGRAKSNAADPSLWDDRPFKCYISCIFSTIMVLKNNKMNAKTFKTQANKLLQPAAATIYIAAFDACTSTVPPGPDECETAGSFAKCMTEKDPENFDIPM